jgi:hypothetical protein
MISTQTLDHAVSTGLLSAAQRDRLVDLERTGIPDVEDEAGADDENLRLIGGGNDLFVTVGVILLTAGAYFVLTTVLPGNTLWIAGLLAAFSWLVAEVVTRQHRMKLSSTVLSLVFITAISTLLAVVVQESYQLRAPDSLWQLVMLRSTVAPAGYLFIGGVIAAAALYFWRFRVPILAAVVAIAATLLAFLQTTLFLYDGVTAGTVAPPSMEQMPELVRAALYMPLICGLVVFAVGVALDIHDRERRKIWSDCAFWLHVVSAPMLVHPLFIMATGQDVVFGSIEPDTSATIMLVPTLAYFGSLGIYYLVNTAANTTGIPAFALVLLVVGALIITFGAGWQHIRRLTIRTTLPTSVLNRLPPIKV